MENIYLDKSNLNHAYLALVELKRSGEGHMFQQARLLGYMEACLQCFGVRETVVVNGLNENKTIMIKSSKWWKKDRKETLEECLVRQTRKYLELD